MADTSVATSVIMESGSASSAAPQPLWTAARAFIAHTKPIASVKFSHDGQFVATASADATVKVWSTTALLERADSVSEENDSTAASESAPAPLVTFRGHDQGVSDVAWSRDGAYLVSASDDKTVRVWDVEQRRAASVLGTPTHSSSFLFSGLPLDAPTSVLAGGSSSSSLSTSGGAIGHASGGSNGIHAPEDEGHSTYVFCCEFNPQGTLIASGSFDESVRLWDVRSGRCVHRQLAHQEPVSCVDFSADGTLLATASYDGLVRVWDVATMQCLREIILEPSAPVAQARFTPNGAHLLVGTLDGRLTLWDYAAKDKPRCVKAFKGHVNRKYCLAATILRASDGPDQNPPRAHVVSGSEDGRIVEWDVATEREIVAAWPAPAAAASRHAVLGLSVHPSQRLVATAAHRSLTLWTRTQTQDEQS